MPKRGTDVASFSRKYRYKENREEEDVCSFHIFTIIRLIATMVVVPVIAD
ncbi:MAG: hypothetical protein OJF51_000566 [Nitrospira sp.]|nr:MAG: hypothetical protein OJF51_000566 [Nitrospira sp.]